MLTSVQYTKHTSHRTMWQNSSLCCYVFKGTKIFNQIKVWIKVSLPKSIVQILSFFILLEIMTFLEACRNFRI